LNRRQWTWRALRRKLANGIHGYQATAGGLMAYGPNIPDMYRRVAFYVHKILKGAKPGELPVQALVKFELVVNLKTAKALGLEAPRFLKLTTIFGVRANEGGDRSLRPLPQQGRELNTKTCQPYSCICDRAGKSLLSVTYFTSTFSLLGIFMGKLTEFVDSLCNGHWISELTA
jgi:ABC transporter substrate binding protein